MQTKIFKKKYKNKIKQIGKILKIPMKNHVSKVKGEYLIFKTSIIRVRTCLLVDNKNEAEIIDQSFVYANKIPYFKLEESINLILKNNEFV